MVATLRKRQRLLEQTPESSKQIKHNSHKGQQSQSTKTSNDASGLLVVPPKPSPRKPSSPFQSSLPTRRSPRLQNGTPVTFLELHEKTFEKYIMKFGKDGLSKKSCHQCRKRTLCHHTRWRKCYLAQGQLCGNCLHWRYGEHVQEVNQNPNWICPVCHGICNCSQCRKANGLPAAGYSYNTILKLGLTSVAHYLTHLESSGTRSDDMVTAASVSVKRSLPSLDTKEVVEPKDSLSSDDWPHERPNHGLIDKKGSELEDEGDSLDSVSNAEEDEMEVEKEQTVNNHVFSNVKDDESTGTDE
ncbi:hypothetical protein IFM89_010065 [Coptis chinensis]|uniref:Zinc-finger domain-containing protein n=1 Tax=Coptis chinensis TaxID=261450 RepID=A0A835LRA3_9MAGN|nr:hypothetical protein IFM89_010065 [Coptis chinensis]